MKIKKHLSFSSLRAALSEIFLNIPDWRQEGKVGLSLHDTLMSGFACLHFQDPSLLQFQQRMQDDQHQNNLRTLFDVTHIPKKHKCEKLLTALRASACVRHSKNFIPGCSVENSWNSINYFQAFIIFL